LQPGGVAHERVSTGRTSADPARGAAGGECEQELSDLRNRDAGTEQDVADPPGAPSIARRRYADDVATSLTSRRVEVADGDLVAPLPAHDALASADEEVGSCPDRC
jgi:hypothetical protein